MSPRHIVRADPDTDLYPLLTSLVVPRPIAWVSTLSAAGSGNLAPHSFFTISCVKPPIVQITSVTEKDTLRNVRQTGEFVISLSSRPFFEQINATSARLPAGVDEAKTAGVTMEPSEIVAPSRVAGSPASLECTLHSTTTLGDSTVIFGSVVAVTLDTDQVDPDRPTIEQLQPLSRLGRNEWGLPPEVVAIDRPT